MMGAALLQVHGERRGGAICLHVGGIEPPGPNGGAGLLRGGFRRRTRLGANVRALLRGALSAAGAPPRPFQRARVVYLRSHRARPLDPDNLTASAKPVLDALVELGVLADDSPEHLVLDARQVARRGRPPFFQLLVSPLEPHAPPP